MKAVRVRAPSGLDNLEVVELADPGEPGPGEICVRVRASSLNYHDYGVVTGMMPNIEDGRIPLSDASGEVSAVGEGVEQFAVGDHVISTFFVRWKDGDMPDRDFSNVPGDGLDGYARETVRMPASAFTHAPRGFSHEHAATLPCAGLTAWRALFEDGDLKPGQTVLVQGTGGVSIFALQFAKAAGARVIATSSSDQKLERVRRLGADHTINYKQCEQWGEAAFEWTGGNGVDHILEVGGPGTLDQSLQAVRTSGHIHVIGMLTGFNGEIRQRSIILKNVRLQGLTVGSHAMQRRMIAAIEANGIEPVVSDRFPLEKLADAFRHEENQNHFGKIVIDI